MIRSGAAMRAVVGMVVLVVLACLIPSALAQDQGESGWEVIETCAAGLSYPVLPRSQWDFEGVIFSENQDGVRAIRTNVDTSYFVALDSAETFSSVGAFSPDGKWFAYPVGVTDFHVNSVGDDAYGIDAIEVVSTDPSRTARRFRWRDFGMGMEPEATLHKVYWFDNERLFFEGEYVTDTGESQPGILNVVSGQIESWVPIEYSGSLFDLSPDATRGLIYDRGSQKRMLMNLDTSMTITSLPDEFWREFVWRFDSTSYFAVIRFEDVASEFQLVSFSREGVPLDVLFSSEDVPGNLSISPQDDLLAFTAGNRLFIADLVNRQIRDLCFTFGDGIRPSPIVWSPDGRQLAFTYDGYPVLLSLDTLEMEVLDYPTGRLLGWYPVE